MKKSPNNWFDVSRNGLAELQAGKPAHYILREFVANAFDTQAATCHVSLEHRNGVVFAVVEDDSPEGFSDLSLAYTLFVGTPRRSDPTKRGRFGMGEKQALSRCTRATVISTKGGVIFDERGRRKTRVRRERGTAITAEFPATHEEFEQTLRVLRTYLVPPHLRFNVNDEEVPSREPTKVVDVKLDTEVGIEGALRRRPRKTKMHLHHAPAGSRSWLYELGIPVCEIDGPWTVDVQQKIPLGVDRETVSTGFLQDVYAEVLNATHEELDPEGASEPWVRQAAGDERAKPEAVKSVVRARWGDRVVAATPSDPNANDRAISEGFRVLRGGDLSPGEWERVREAQAVPSSSQMFGERSEEETVVEPTPAMARVGSFAQRLGLELLGREVPVRFVKIPGSYACATYSRFRGLTFVVNRLPGDWFDDPLSLDVLTTILHELGHEVGEGHHDVDYHEKVARLGAKGIRLALEKAGIYDVEMLEAA